MAFHKIQKDEKDSNAKEIGAENQGMLTFESNWSELIEDCRSQLSEIGIPVEMCEQLGTNDNQF